MGGYLGRVSKALICEAVIEAKGKATTDNIATLKKGDMADRAAELVTGTGLLPAMLRAAATAQDDPGAVNCCPGRTVALGRSLLAALRHRAHWRGTPLGRCAADFSFALPPLLHRSRATSTRQGFDTAIGMRPISSPDALVIEIQNPSRLPSYAISCARAASRQGVFVRREFHSVIVVVGTSVANHLKRIPLSVRPSHIPLWQLGQVTCGSCK